MIIHRLAALLTIPLLVASAARAAPPDYATWLGGTSQDIAYGAATAPDGTLVIAGRTTGITFPFTPGGPITPVATFSSQPFVARVNRTVAGSAGILFADYLGGTGGDGGGEARAVTVDGAGYIYVVGWTQTWTLPVVGGFATAPSDHNNGFLVKLAPDGKTILYSTYIGGGHNVDEMDAVVVDDSGIATIAGHSASSNFPIKSGFAGASQNGLFDAVILRIDTTKTGAASLLWSTAYGGSGDDTPAASIVLLKGDDLPGKKGEGYEVYDKATAFANIEGVSGQQSTVTSLRVFGYLIGALVIGVFFYVLTLQKIPQIGVLKAIGASNLFVFRQILLQVVGISLIGLAISVPLAMLTDAGLRRLPDAVPIAFTTGTFVTTAALLLVTSIVGTAFSARQVIKVDPIIALGQQQ